ncbi:hypothetical protein FOXG_22909 [Fusarium oxysporum f. sp. lycopersici 4287]|uniref:Uncharacterized protein n=1 Tax=Fusarium oxysporum f. sp. lycopersici (strain 4287 / CBS 123668 / FGSC 9935 / NRRL 34936) TaxID=426428 RepID=A0A0J9WBH3_FUSO4|nr:uncharacterized protein FOXG_22909 [Fusarium oxysporum f. sp. lycopersici 4287]KNB20719.1 hypothetical protein FOXG_22909 [Fusarium oxysporum f. sp. lycopersici 4287]
MDLDYLGGMISPTWLARELSGLKKLEEALWQGWSLKAEEAAFLAAFTGLSARYEEWLENVIIEAEWVLCILPLVRKDYNAK